MAADAPIDRNLSREIISWSAGPKFIRVSSRVALKFSFMLGFGCGKKGLFFTITEVGPL